MCIELVSRDDDVVRYVLLLTSACLAACGCSSSDPADGSPDASEAPLDAAIDSAIPRDDATSGAEASVDAAAEASAWVEGKIQVTEEPGSAWSVALEGKDVVARHADRDVALLIDPTNGASDGRYAGIYVSVDKTPRFNGRYNATDCSMFVPDRPFKNQQAVVVHASGTTLTVTMTEGSLSEMTDSQFPSDEPFRWQSTWELETAGLRLAASGLYYLLPSMDDCMLTLLGEGGAPIDELQLTTATAPFLEYFHDVRTIQIASPQGSFSISSDAQILQVQVPSYPDTGLFELDFDHSFKEKGQADIHIEAVLPLGG